MPPIRRTRQTYESETPAQKALTRVFRQAVEGVQHTPEEPCHKCIRLYGIFTSDMNSAYGSIGDHYADAGYAASDVLEAADDIKLQVKEGCIDQGFVADVDQVITMIRGSEDFDKDDVEKALDQLDELTDKILDAVVEKCRKLAPPAR